MRKQCPECGGAHNNEKYCSRKCAAKAKARVPHTPKDKSKATLKDFLD
ncbi:hypothetical protein [Synechococcus phage MA10]|uniref:Uncharacterized protein n=1 Tax=Synechococcus phage S-H34 TaxID=2718942 RepID=A0A6G8R6T8_9CAUD|nr:hypothetical protein PQC15_gp241 [Synechococcus phage S-H34]QIN97107.1 hypothetical protein [Synechococcus phage S-H34]